MPQADHILSFDPPALGDIPRDFATTPLMLRDVAARTECLAAGHRPKARGRDA